MLEIIENRLRATGEKPMADTVRLLRTLRGKDVPMDESNPPFYMLQRLEGALRRAGEDPVAEQVRLLRTRGKDIPWGASGFTPEQYRKLKLMNDDCAIYLLRGQTIASLREASCPIEGCSHNESVTNSRSLLSEVAIWPGVFINGSTYEGNQTLDKQDVFLDLFNRELHKEIPGTTAIRGSVADCAELAFTYHTTTGEPLGSFLGLEILISHGLRRQHPVVTLRL